MKPIAPSLELKIARNPNAPQNVVVRVDGDLDARRKTLEERGFQVRRKLKLIRGLAATAPGASVRQLADEPWVTSIEEDQQVHTM